MTRDEMIVLARKSAQQHGIRPEMFLGQLEQESKWNPSARSRAGAMGVAQFMPDTAKDFGINPMDPAQAIPAAAKYMAQLQKRYGGSEKSALQAYNWGLGNMDTWLKTGKGKKGQPMPKEAVDYAPVIMAHARKYGAPGQDLGAVLADKGAAPPAAGGATRPAMVMTSPGGGRHVAMASNEEEADLMAGLADKNYPDHVQQGMVNVLSQLLPARDLLDGKNLFASTEDAMTPSLPSDYDHLISDIIDKA